MIGQKVSPDAAHDQAHEKRAEAARSAAHITEATVCHGSEITRFSFTVHRAQIEAGAVPLIRDELSTFEEQPKGVPESARSEQEPESGS